MDKFKGINNSTNEQNDINELIAMSVKNAKARHNQRLKSNKLPSLSPEQIAAIKNGQITLATLFKSSLAITK